MRRAGFVATRWLGVGLASALAVVTLSLAITGRLGLYINPESSWFAVAMSIVVLVGAAASCALPLGAESDHGHDHGDGHPEWFDSRGGSAHDGVGAPQPAPPGRERSPREVRTIARSSDESGHILRGSRDSPKSEGHEGEPTRPLAAAATVSGGVLASAIVVLALVLPPASLSAELAMSRDTGAPPLFGGTDVIVLASTGDTASFGVGEWSAVFATATNPEAFDGEPVTLTGFVTPGQDFALTRLVITHCVIDAQPASVPVITGAAVPETGQWVTVNGTVRATSDGRLEIDATSVEPIAEPEDPYEY